MMLLAALLLQSPTHIAQAQSRIAEMPGYETYSKVAPQIAISIKSGRLKPTWADNSRSFTYDSNGTQWRYTVQTGTNRKITNQDRTSSPDRTNIVPGLVLARGRGAEANVVSPDGKHRAYSRDMNLWLKAEKDGAEERALTTDGGPEARIRHGVGSYVYLEEFKTRSPVWWSPDSRKVAWMRYDETKVPDYVLTLDQSEAVSRLHTQAYPHPGEPNPVADLLVHDLDTGKTTIMDTREGQPFTNDVVGHYVWSAQWTKDSKQILARRANRLQNIYDLAACTITTAQCKSIARNFHPQSWADGTDPVLLEDGKRFIWTSERNGYRNLYLYDLSGELLTELTNHKHDVISVETIDEKRGEVW